MNKLYLKKLLVALTMTGVLTTTTVPVNQVHAATVAVVFTGGFAIAIAAIGGCFIGVGAERFLSGRRQNGLFGVALGVLILDDNRQVIVAKSLDSNSGDKLGLSEHEREIYNNRLPEINLTIDALTEEANNARLALETSKDGGPMLSEAEKEKHIREVTQIAYLEIADEVGLSEAELKVIQKVFSQSINP